MAYKQASVFFLIALIFFAAANPLAHGQLLPGLPLPTNVTIGGILCCTPTGNCLPGSQPAPGAIVDLNCTTLTGQIERIRQGITTANGSFSITVNLTSLPLNLLSLCSVRIRLPLNKTICPVLSGVNGVLAGLPGPIFTALGRLLSTVLGLVRLTT